MSLRFLVDAQLPPALARFLSSSGHTAEHVADVGLKNEEDDPIWKYAISRSAVIVTKDEDFPRRKMLQPAGPIVVWLRKGNCSKRALLQWFRPLMPDIIDRIQQGEELLEIL